MLNRLKFLRKKIRETGQSLVEIVIAMAIFSLMAVSMIGLLFGGLTLSLEGGKITEAGLLAQEGLEALRSIKARAWNELIFDRSAVQVVSNEWSLVGENTIEEIGDFSRTIDFFDVYRNLQNEIVSFDDAGSFLDLESKKITATVSWDTGRGITNSVEKTFLLTNWDSDDWVQTNWSDGGGQQIFDNVGFYDFDDGNIEVGVVGEISLKEIATSTFLSSGYLVSSAYDLGLNNAPSLIYADIEMPELCLVCEVSIQIQSALDVGGSPGPWSSFWSGFEGEDNDESDYYTASSIGVLVHTDHNDDRWLRYKIILSGDGNTTPIVKEIKINHKN